MKITERNEKEIVNGVEKSIKSIDFIGEEFEEFMGMIPRILTNNMEFKDVYILMELVKLNPENFPELQNILQIFIKD